MPFALWHRHGAARLDCWACPRRRALAGRTGGGWVAHRAGGRLGVLRFRHLRVRPIHAYCPAAMSALSGTPRPLGSRPLRAVGSCPFVLSSLGCACFEAARCARYWQWQSSTSQATRLAPAPAGAAGWPLATRARPSVRVVPFVWCLCARGGAPDWPPLNFAAWPSVLSLLWFFVLSSLGWVCFEAARSVHWSQCRILGNSQAARLAPARTNVQGRRIGRRWLPVHGCLCRLGGSASRRRGVFAARSGSRVRHRPLDSRPLRAVSIGLAAVELRCVAVCAVVVVVLRAQLARVGLRRDGAVRSLVAVALFGQFAGRSARARPDRRTQRTWDVHTDASRASHARSRACVVARCEQMQSPLVLCVTRALSGGRCRR